MIFYLTQTSFQLTIKVIRYVFFKKVSRYRVTFQSLLRIIDVVDG
jgi:hypothetical protein